MRTGVASELPPYFWTRIGLDERLKRSSGTEAPLAWGDAPASGAAVNIAFSGEPLRQEHRALPGAQLGVVREDDVLDAFQHRLLAEPSDRHCHAIAGVAIPFGLRPKRIGVDTKEAVGRRRQPAEAVDAEPFHGSRRRQGTHRPLGADKHGLGMAVLNVHPRAGAGHTERCRLFPGPEDLPG